MRRHLIEAGYRVGAIPPWLVLNDDRWSCLECGWSTDPEWSTWALYVTGTGHTCRDEAAA